MTTKIIDLYGLPGCGKSTLMKNLNSSLGVGQSQFCTMSDVTRRFKQLSLLAKVRYLRPSLFVRIALFEFLATWKAPAPFKLYRPLFSFAILDQYCTTFCDSSIVVLEHGFTQAIISLLHGRKESLSKLERQLLKNIFRSFQSHYSIYCKVSAQTSANRIHMRGRAGRIDNISNEQILVGILNKQIALFESVNKIQNELLGYKVDTINFENEQHEIIKEINGILKK